MTCGETAQTVPRRLPGFDKSPSTNTPNVRSSSQPTLPFLPSSRILMIGPSSGYSCCPFTVDSCRSSHVEPTQDCPSTAAQSCRSRVRRYRLVPSSVRAGFCWHRSHSADRDLSGLVRRSAVRRRGEFRIGPQFVEQLTNGPYVLDVWFFAMSANFVGFVHFAFDDYFITCASMVFHAQQPRIWPPYHRWAIVFLLERSG